MIGGWGSWGLARPTALQQLQQQVSPLSTGGRGGPTLQDLQPAATGLDTSGGRGGGFPGGSSSSGGTTSSGTGTGAGSSGGYWLDPEVWNPLMPDPNQGRPADVIQPDGQPETRIVKVNWRKVGIGLLLIMGAIGAAFGVSTILGKRKKRRKR